ncbi:hypothetical protein ACHAWF_001158 [Thalassiosira exigua]
MAHGGPNAGTVAGHAPPQHAHSGIPGAGSGTAAPGTSYAALGADLLDRTQSLLSARAVRGAAKYPIAAVDVYGDDVGTSYFPPLEREDGEDDDEMAAMMKAREKVQKGSVVRSVGGSKSGGGCGDVRLKKDDGAAYKAVKRYLTKGGGTGAVLDDALVDGTGKGGEEEGSIVIPSPRLLLGARRFSDLNPAAKSAYASSLPALVDESPSPSPANDREEDPSSSLTLTTINMDGNSAAKGDDYDRVAYRLRLHSKKKVRPRRTAGVRGEGSGAGRAGAIYVHLRRRPFDRSRLRSERRIAASLYPVTSKAS